MSEDIKNSDEEPKVGAIAEIEDDPVEVRRAKREALIAEGKNPYGHAFEYSHHVADLNERYANLGDGENTEDRVQIAGRIMAKRDQGKIIFMELKDSTASLQLFCRINALGEEVFAEMKDLDVGDWIGVSGLMMRTRRGQLSVAVDTFELLSKSLRPLPEKFHGLADKETQLSSRYVDLVMTKMCAIPSKSVSRLSLLFVAIWKTNSSTKLKRLFCILSLVAQTRSPS